MFVRIHSAKNYGNTGSCRGIVEYLEKENEELYQENEDLYLQNRQMFFDQTDNSVSLESVISKTDSNCKKLNRNDARFYMISVNPSQKEMEFMAREISGRNVKNLEQLTLGERRIFEAQLRDYTRQVMDVYGRNFNKDRGLTGNDILYNAKIEHERKYSRFDDQVKEGLRKSGELKEGFQSHVHIVVSRKDITNSMKLSPFTNHKASQNLLNGKKVSMGFNRKEFVQKCEQQFDKQFNYNRALEHSFKYRHTMKNVATQLVNSYGRQALSRYIPGYNILSRASNMKKGLSSEDQLKQLTSLFMQNKHSAQLMKAMQAAYRPEKLVIEVAKKVSKYVIEGSKLTI